MVSLRKYFVINSKNKRWHELCFQLRDRRSFRDNKEKSAHSRFRKGGTDYFDESYLTHHLGNDDFKNGHRVYDEDNTDNPYLVGKNAGGHQDMDQDLMVSPEEKESENNKNVEK